MNERDIELATQAGFDSFDIELFQSIVKLADIIRADEREACAKICDFEWGTGAEKDAGIMFAAVIRARGET